MEDPIRIEQLKYFVNLYDTRSFTQTAANFYMTQQGMSDAIKRMENELGLPLIIRERKELFFNEHGEYVYERAKKILEEYTLVEDYCFAEKNKDLLALKSSLKIAVHPRVYQYNFLNVVSKFRKRCPNVQLHIESEGNFSRYPDLINKNEMDLGFLLVSKRIQEKMIQEKHDVDIYHIKTFSLGVVCTKAFPLFYKKEANISEVSEMPVVTYNQAVMDAYEEEELGRQQTYFVSDATVHKNMVLEGLAVDVITQNEYHLDYSEHTDDVRYIPMQYDEMLMSAIVNNKTEISPAAAYFLSLCREELELLDA